MSINKLKSIDYLFVFKIVYFILTLMSFNIVFAMRNILTYISIGLTVIAFLIILKELGRVREYKNSETILLGSFLLSYLISTIFTYQYGIVENIKAMVWMAIQFFIVFGVTNSVNKERCQKEKNIITKMFVLYTFISAVIGVTMMFINYYSYEIINGVVVKGGFLWNRLWGVYTDPNYGAVFAVVSSLFTLNLYREESERKVKVFFVMNIILQYFFLCLSDSRTGMVAAIFAFSIWIVLNLNKIESLKIKGKQMHLLGLKKALLICLSVIVFAGAFTVSINITQKVAGEIRSAVALLTYEDDEISDEKKDKIEKDSKVGREDEDINEGDYSNARFSIWSSAFEIYKESPIVGVSFRNINEYAKDNLPDTFLAGKRTAFESMHNFVVDIMVSQGTIGLILLIALIGTIVLKLKKLFIEYAANGYSLILEVLPALIAILVSGMFYSEIFYMNTGGAFLFWFLLGYLVKMFKCIELERGEGVD